MVATIEKNDNCETLNYVIRDATVDDAGGLTDYLSVVLADRMASIADRDEMPLDDFHQREYLKRMGDNPLGIALVAECEGEIVGFLTCEAGRRRKIKHTADLGMSVREDWQGRGVGTALLKRTEEWARGTGQIEKLTLNVFEHNRAAIHLYQKAGFQVEGVLRRQIKLDDAHQDLLLMGKFMDESEGELVVDSSGPFE